MPYIAQLIRAQSYSVSVSGEKQAALTFFNFRRDRISETEALVLDPTASNGTASTGPRSVPSGVTRILLFASLEGGTGSLSVNQTGQTNPPVTLAPDGTVVMNPV